MNYEHWISYKYLQAKKGRFLSFLNFVSIAGVAIGVMALIVVIGVMTGFANNLREKIIGTTPHIMIEKETGIRDYARVMASVQTVKDVEAVSAYVQGNIFLEDHGQAVGMVVRGINPQSETQITKVKQYIVKGQLSDFKEDQIVIGSELARFYGYKLGDEVTLISPSSGMSGQGWKYKLKVGAIFTTGMTDFDMNLIILDLKKAQEVFGLASDEVTGIGVKLKDPYHAREIKEKISSVLGYSFLVKTWIDINRGLFEALFLEKWGLFIILTLMVLVASFNIISTLIVMVSTKTHDIGILKSIGVPKKAIWRIFTNQGIYIGLKGIFWGLVGGFGISYILKTYVQVPKEIYSIEHVPVDIQLWDVLAIVGAAFVISYLATIYPASRAASLEPVEALRYE
jgi:lipoprotein-releasing system permease protein